MLGNVIDDVILLVSSPNGRSGPGLHIVIGGNSDCAQNVSKGEEVFQEQFGLCSCRYIMHMADLCVCAAFLRKEANGCLGS
jgi:hypothetical protein